MERSFHPSFDFPDTVLSAPEDRITPMTPANEEIAAVRCKAGFFREVRMVIQRIARALTSHSNRCRFLSFLGIVALGHIPDYASAEELSPTDMTAPLEQPDDRFISPDPVLDLISQLGADHFRDRADAAAILEALGSRAAEQLITFGLSGGPGEDREIIDRSRRLLEVFGSGAACDLVRVGLRSQDAAIVYTAKDLLLRLGSFAIPALVECGLKSNDPVLISSVTAILRRIDWSNANLRAGIDSQLLRDPKRIIVSINTGLAPYVSAEVTSVTEATATVEISESRNVVDIRFITDSVLSNPNANEITFTPASSQQSLLNPGGRLLQFRVTIRVRLRALGPNGVIYVGDRTMEDPDEEVGDAGTRLIDVRM